MQAAQLPAGFNDLSDVEVARRIAAGDRAAITGLMRRHNQTLYRTARSILKDDAEAEDCVQEAYLSAFGAMASFRAEAMLSTWLIRIVVNEAITRKRRIDRRGDVIWLAGDAGLDIETGSDEIMARHTQRQPERDAVRQQTRQLIEASIDRLPETFRTVFVLRAVEELSVDETVAATSAPVRCCAKRSNARSIAHCRAHSALPVDAATASSRPCWRAWTDAARPSRLIRYFSA